MAASGQFNIQVSATTSGAIAQIKALNRQIEAMRAPAVAMHKQLSRLSENIGLTRLAEGVKTFVGHIKQAVIHIGAFAAGLIGITGAASIAGMGALAKSWADVGEALGFAGARLGMATPQLHAIEHGARLAGASAGSLTATLEKMQEVAAEAKWHINPEMTVRMTTLGISPAAKPMEEFMQIAEAMKKHAADPAVTNWLAKTFSIAPDLLPMMRKGAAGVREFREQANKLNPWTEQNQKNANALSEAWHRLVESGDSLRNQIVSQLAPAMTGLMEDFSKWLSQPGTAQAFADAISSIAAALKSIPWVEIGQQIAFWAQKLFEFAKNHKLILEIAAALALLNRGTGGLVGSAVSGLTWGGTMLAGKGIGGLIRLLFGGAGAAGAAGAAGGVGALSSGIGALGIGAAGGGLGPLGMALWTWLHPSPAGEPPGTMPSIPPGVKLLPGVGRLHTEPYGPPAPPDMSRGRWGGGAPWAENTPQIGPGNPMMRLAPTMANPWLFTPGGKPAGTQSDPVFIRLADPGGYGIGGGAGAQASLQAPPWGRNVAEIARRAFPEGAFDLPKNVTEAVRTAAGIFKLNQNWMAGLARAEGGVDAQGRPRTSSAGAFGVMQLMPGTAAGLGVNPNIQSENIAGGMRYFQQMLALFHGNCGAATAAYNWGPGKEGSQHRAILEHLAETRDPSQLPLQTQQYLERIQQGMRGQPAAAPQQGTLDAHIKVEVDAPAKVKVRGSSSAPHGRDRPGCRAQFRNPAGDRQHPVLAGTHGRDPVCAQLSGQHRHGTDGIATGGAWFRRSHHYRKRPGIRRMG